MPVAQVEAYRLLPLARVSPAFVHRPTSRMRPASAGGTVLTAIALRRIAGDGEATVFEGAAPVALCAMPGACARLDRGLALGRDPG